MQEFEVVLRVRINTVETVSSPEVAIEIKNLVEDFDYGTIEIKEIKEV